MPAPKSASPREPSPAGSTRQGRPLETRIAHLLSTAGRRQSARFAELLKPLGLRPKHFALMNAVDLADGPSQQELGVALGLDPSGLISAIDELEAARLVERRRVRDDRRRHALFLTRAGRAKLARAREASRKRAQELIAPLTDAEARTLHDLLQRIDTADQPGRRSGADGD